MKILSILFLLFFSWLSHAHAEVLIYTYKGSCGDLPGLIQVRYLTNIHQVATDVCWSVKNLPSSDGKVADLEAAFSYNAVSSARNQGFYKFYWGDEGCDNEENCDFKNVRFNRGAFGISNDTIQFSWHRRLRGWTDFSPDLATGISTRMYRLREYKMSCSFNETVKIKKYPSPEFSWMFRGGDCLKWID